jgi:hypothetical protein
VKGGGGGGGDGDNDDDMLIQSITGHFNIFFYNFEDILYDHSRSSCKDTLIRKICRLRYTDLVRDQDCLPEICCSL